MKALGWILIFAGIVGDLYFAFGFSTSIPTERGNIVNLDLQQDRLFGFLDAQVNFLAGLLILLFVNLSLKVQIVAAPAAPVNLADELAKRKTVDEARLREIVSQQKNAAPEK